MNSRCRPDGKKNATQLILNLLELMADQGVERSQGTYDMLLRHWAARRIFKAVLATVEDMISAGIPPDAGLLRSCVYDADSVRHAPSHSHTQSARPSSAVSTSVWK